jgi:hypothetical protein
MAKLLTKSAFAALCGVNPSSITKACAAALAPALAGNRIDADHPAAQAYRAERERAAAPEPVEGIDPLYAEALAHCRESCRWSATSLRAKFGIGSTRAADIVAQFRAAGVFETYPDDPPPGLEVTFAQVAQVAAALPALRGHAAARERLKSSPMLPPDSQPDAPEIPANIESFADMTLRELIHRFGTDVRFLDWLKATKEIELIAERRIKNATASGKLITRDLVARGVIDPFNSAHLRLMSDGAKSIAGAVVAKHQAGGELVEIERYVSDVIGSFLRPVKSKVAQALRQATEASDIWGS